MNRIDTPNLHCGYRLYWHPEFRRYYWTDDGLRFVGLHPNIRKVSTAVAHVTKMDMSA